MQLQTEESDEPATSTAVMMVIPPEPASGPSELDPPDVVTENVTLTDETTPDNDTPNNTGM